jgi:hypothetical protein
MARCGICGAELENASQPLCGGDTCLRVLMKDGPGRAGAVARINPMPDRQDGSEWVPNRIVRA